MIKKLTEENRTEILEYLYQEPAINIFIIGDIENFGFDVDFQDVWADYKNNQIDNVLLRYKENVIYYSHKNEFNKDYLPIIERIKPQFISAKGALMELIKPYFKEFKEKPMYFCEATKANSVVNDDHIIDLQTPEQARKVFRLLHNIEEFDSMKSQTEEEFVVSKLQSIKHSKCYYIEEDDLCVSTVATVADTTVSAMVVAVATDPNYRQKGYASLLMNKLLDEYINNRNKSLCLFYDNPAAGKIYHRLGFKDIDKWVMLVRK